MTYRSTIWALRDFILISIGQFISVIGSRLSSFALGVWVYQQTESVTQFALLSLSALLPGLILSPIIGTFVDRWDRRYAMLLSDSVAATNTLIVVLLLFSNRLELWHVCLVTVISSIFGALHAPAFLSSVPLFIPKEHLGRANGLLQASFGVAQLVAPILAGILIVTVGVLGAVLVDCLTFLVAIITLLPVRIPKPQSTLESETPKGLLWRETAYGWTYIKARPGLLGLLAFFAVDTFLGGIVSILATPLVLSFTSPDVLGKLLSVGGSGILVGSLLMGIWGGPKHRIHGVLGGILASALFITLAGLQPSIPLLGVAAFGFFLLQPIISSCAQSIFQITIAPDVQGRFFAISGAITGSTLPFAYLIAGMLADDIFEPLLASGGLLAGSIGQLIGVGPGRGIGFLFIVVGILTMLLTSGAYLYPRLRLVEDELSGSAQIA
jgi:MFS transporter, DHA3 family, macrolide efflux protein